MMLETRKERPKVSCNVRARIVASTGNWREYCLRRKLLFVSHQLQPKRMSQQIRVSAFSPRFIQSNLKNLIFDIRELEAYAGIIFRTFI